MIWAAVLASLVGPVWLAATSPLLAWRDTIYIIGGFSGIVGLGLLLVQPLLALGALPCLSPRGTRHVHRFGGIALVLAVVTHVAALWVTSPPDMIDALLFASPTPFSAWGVVAMWAVLVTGAFAGARRRLRLRPRTWRWLHLGLATIIVTGTIVHAVLIEGTMEPVSKISLCALVGLATLGAIINRLRGRAG